MKHRKVWLFFALAVIVLVATIAFVNTRTVDVDSCLDRGGAYNYGSKTCEGVR